MQSLSAFDAVAPAVERTRLFLFSPFRPGRSWKLAAVGYLSLASVLYLPFPLLYFLPVLVFPLSAGVKIALLSGVLLLTLPFTYIFHLCSRLGFAFFDLVLRRGEFVAPAWRLYGAVARQWSTWKVLFGLAVTLLGAPLLVAYVRTLLPVWQEVLAHAAPPGSASAGAPTLDTQLQIRLMTAFFGGYFLFLISLMFLFLAAALVNDFVVPFLALESTSPRVALRRFWQLLRAEPGQFLAYALLKAALGLVGLMVVAFAYELILLLLVMVLALLAGALGFILHLFGVPWDGFLIVAAVIGIPCILAVGLYLSLLGNGTLATFLQAYLLYFLGGRYAALGEVLDRTEPRSFAPVIPSGAGWQQPWPVP